MSIKISEIISLIEACGNAGVKKFVHETEKGLPINIEFFERVPQEATVVDLPQAEIRVSLPQEKAIEISQDFDKAERFRLLQEDFDLLHLQDPEKYEELLANDKLGDFGEAHAE